MSGASGQPADRLAAPGSINLVERRYAGYLYAIDKA